MTSSSALYSASQSPA